MVGRLIVTQGEWGRALLAAAEKILGRPAEVDEVALGWDEDPVHSSNRLRSAIEGADRGDGVLVLTDLFGGTPARIAMSQLAPDRVEVLSGLNLPMIVRLGCPGTEAMTLGDLSRWLKTKVVESVRLGSDCVQKSFGGECATEAGRGGREDACSDD